MRLSLISDCFSISPGFQLDYKDSYLACHRRPEMDSVDENCVGCFQTVRITGNVLDFPSRNVPSKKRMVSDIQVKR